MNGKFKRCLEGPVVVVLGIIGLILSLQIRSNPVKTQGILNIFTQAKMLPIVVSVLTILLGLSLTMQLNKGLLTTATMPKETWFRVLLLTLITLAYLIVAYYAGFLIPTFVYCFVMLLYLNWKQKNPVWMAVLAAVYTIVTVFLVPRILNLNLMLF